MDFLILLIGSIMGICITSLIVAVLGYMNKKKKTLSRSFLILVLLISMLFSVVGCSEGSFQGSFYDTIDEAFEAYQPEFTKYKILYRIDTKLNPTPIILGYLDREMSEKTEAPDEWPLLIFPIETQESKDHTKYRISESFGVVNAWFIGDTKTGELIDETDINIVDEFPGIWFGVVYPDKKDKIQINGRTPELYDIQYAGTDYVFWYIARDEAEPVLTFEG